MKHIIQYFMFKIKKDNVGAYAAQATLFFIMSFIPFMLVLVSLLRYTPITESMMLSAIELVSPGYVSSTVISVVDEVYHNSAGVLIFSIILAVYSAAKTIQSLRYGLNIVYEIEETRNWFVLRLRAMVETVILILVILLLMVLLMFGQRIQNILVEYTPVLSVVTAVILKLRMLILFFILILVFGGIYKVLPNRKATFRSQLVGAVACAVSWYVFSFFVSIYVNFFNGFSIYGSLTVIILLMFWLSIAMYIFLVCAQLNYAFEMVLMEIKLDVGLRKQKKLQKRMEKQRLQKIIKREEERKNSYKEKQEPDMKEKNMNEKHE